MAQPWLVQWYYHGAPEDEVFVYVTNKFAHAVKLARDDSDTVTTACPAAMIEHPMTVGVKSLFSTWLWIQANKEANVFGLVPKRHYDNEGCVIAYKRTKKADFRKNQQ